jgi:hypothetical protein
MSIYKADQLLVAALKAEGFQTVTFGTVSETDLKKQSIFPLCHVTLVSNSFTNSITTITYDITILDVVDVNSLDPREMQNDFGLTSNIEDVFHDLAFKFNRAYQTFRKDTASIIEVPDNVSLDAGYAEMQNKLAGYRLSLPITLANSGLCSILSLPYVLPFAVS